MTRSLNGKVAVITGAGSGMGRSMALRLAEDDARIAIWDINGEGAEETAKMVRDAGGTAIAVTVDCSDRAAIKAAADQTRSELGKIAILVNNAGIAPFTPFLEIDDALLDKVVDVNFKGPFYCSQEVVPDMIEAGWGRVINITSITLTGGWENLAPYVQSKGALLGLTRAWAREFGKWGISVNAIAPGAFPTDAEKIHPDPEGYNAMVLDRQAIKRRGSPADISAAILFLMSEGAGFITGQSIAVNGGWTME